jgi:protoheme IX farnesyltransferase
MSASAAVFNQVIERETDQKMRRTSGRSLPSGRIPGIAAVGYGVLLGILGFASLWNKAHPLAAWISLAGHLFYVVIYTKVLKKRSVQNIVIGGAAGSVGPLIGWAAASGELTVAPWIMFLIIFLWTPPHFWALALKYKSDYAQAGIPMYPVVYGDARTRKVIFLYSVTLIPAILALYFQGACGELYLAIASILTGKFVADAYLLWRDGHNQRAMPLFHYSCVYTLGIFAAMAFDGLI